MAKETLKWDYLIERIMEKAEVDEDTAIDMMEGLYFSETAETIADLREEWNALNDTIKMNYLAELVY